MEIKLLDIAAGVPSSEGVEFSDEVFGRDFNQSLIHQVVCAYQAAARAGTKAQKSRSEVRGGGAKPWRQKGGGRARAGTIRSPLWRGGGVTFAAKPRDYSQKVNKKMYLGAVRSILSELVRQERLWLTSELNVSGKTRDLAAQLRALKLDNVLLVTEDLNPQLFLAARNLPRVAVCTASEVSPLDLVGFDQVLFTVPALKRVEERLS